LGALKGIDRGKTKGSLKRTMSKKLLLNLVSGVLLISFCGMEKAVGAASRFPQESGDVYSEERRAMRDLHFEGKKKSGGEERKAVKPKKSNRSRSAESRRKAELPPPPPPLRQPEPQVALQEEPEPQGVVVPVTCSEDIVMLTRFPDCCSSDLWQRMLALQRGTLKSHNWKGSVGIKNLVYHLAQRHAQSDDQNEKDAIALYFLGIAECYSGELAGGDNEDAEQEAIDFVKECLVDEQGELLFLDRE
jgi:hypothetical protein